MVNSMRFIVTEGFLSEIDILLSNLIHSSAKSKIKDPIFHYFGSVAYCCGSDVPFCGSVDH